MKEIIERLIRTGKTTTEIQSEIIEFPDDVTTEYLEGIGFEENLAIKLKWKLRQNNKIREEDIKAEKGRKKLLETREYRFSPNANPDFILMDTCAMLDERGRNIISRSSKIVVIESVLQEIEKVLQEEERKKKKDSTDYKIISTIKTYKRKILKQAKFKQKLDTPKEDMNYCDDKILYYIENLMQEQRPTLLTADANLASRAEAHGFEYIFITKSKKKIQTIGEEKVENQEEAKETDKKVINGIKFELKSGIITVTGVNKKAKIYFVEGENATLAKQGDKKEVKDFNYIILILRQKSNRELRVNNISIVNGEIVIDEEIIQFINEIYRMNLPEEIQDEARRMFID